MFSNLIRLALITVFCIHAAAVTVHSQENPATDQEVVRPEDQKNFPRKQRDRSSGDRAVQQEQPQRMNAFQRSRTFQEEHRVDRFSQNRSPVPEEQPQRSQERNQDLGTSWPRSFGHSPQGRESGSGTDALRHAQTPAPSIRNDEPRGTESGTRPAPSDTVQQPRSDRDSGDRTGYQGFKSFPAREENRRPASDDNRREASPVREEYRRPDNDDRRREAPTHEQYRRPDNDDRRREAPKHEQYRRPDNDDRRYRYSKPVVHHLPSQHAVILHGRDRYHYYDGRFYIPWSFGFMLVRPPLGLIVMNIPLGSRIVVSAGISYYVFGDVYYRRVPMGYEVVEPVRGQASGWPDRVQVVTDLLNLRYGPDSREEIIAQVERYTVLKVLGSAPGWLYVEIEGEDVRGWVMEQYVRAGAGRG